MTQVFIMHWGPLDSKAELQFAELRLMVDISVVIGFINQLTAMGPHVVHDSNKRDAKCSKLSVLIYAD